MKRLLPLVLALFATPAFAHLPPGEYGSFAAGISHPLFGLDHILAMVAVGLWASQLGGRALWAVPAAFVSVMVLGFVLAIAGLPLPFVEPMILASTVVLGLVVAMAVRTEIWVGAALVGLFALFHGHAHGGELGDAGALRFGIGFALATAALHAAGIGLGLWVGRLGARLGGTGAILPRGLGALTALAGLGLAFG
ncbi:HupE/UreJ family protein [Sinisalibacter aestuarii]|uniref:Protein hupE n=1 Tax=Sinisalibacter aestuarii TaxID=2949426 RepID=A0ABQ5LWA7_9RHOB|nr:HupE/UreJ family protein [Sinisalibacter aestuarii]GKY88908.1 protein hupE [Sinisalibacter aestuarii]